MKMYRHGAATGIYGLEFICKWSALEGLVCGGEPAGKLAMLLNRMPALFPAARTTVEEKVKELKLRNEAVHEARAFHTDHLSDSNMLSRLKSTRWRQLFLAVVVFAFDHLGKADSVTTLWPLVVGHQLPTFASQQRPSDMPRYVITSYMLNTHLIGKGFGAINDAAFAQQAS